MGIKKIEELIELAKKDIKEAAEFDIEDDDGELAREIYKRLFDFYDEKKFSGDVIFTWKSPSLVQEGNFIGRRNSLVDNKRVIGNIFPNYKTNQKYSLNLNRNSHMGDFPHDYFDIYLDHVAKYAFKKDRPQIMEYYPLKRAILYEENKKYFDKFNDFDDFISRNFLTEISSIRTPFLDMNFADYKKLSEKLMHDRGILMLKKMLGI